MSIETWPGTISVIIGAIIAGYGIYVAKKHNVPLIAGGILGGFAGAWLLDKAVMI